MTVPAAMPSGSVSGRPAYGWGDSKQWSHSVYVPGLSSCTFCQVTTLDGSLCVGTWKTLPAATTVSCPARPSWVKTALMSSLPARSNDEEPGDGAAPCGSALHADLIA